MKPIEKLVILPTLVMSKLIKRPSDRECFHKKELLHWLFIRVVYLLVAVSTLVIMPYLFLVDFPFFNDFIEDFRVG